MPVSASFSPLIGNGVYESESLYEVVNGTRTEKPPMGAFATILATTLARLLGDFVAKHVLGIVTVETLFQLGPNGPQRRPDVAFVEGKRAQSAPSLVDDPAAWDVVPNLTVEIISPTNTASEVQDKLNDYFGAGVETVWVVFPRQRQVMIHEPSRNARCLQIADVLDGGSVIAGFSMPLSVLFADPTGRPG